MKSPGHQSQASKEAKAAARELRIKIHSLLFEGGEARGPYGALNPRNAKWLDKASAEDAEIIDRYFAVFMKDSQRLDFVEKWIHAAGLKISMQPKARKVLIQKQDNKILSRGETLREAADAAIAAVTAWPP